MRLLPLSAFAELFGPFQGKRVGYVRPIGNVGDRLIEMATFQLFDAFEIEWKIQNPAGPVDSSVDELIFGGGGNMGTRYRNNWELRSQIRTLGRPITIFPQSFTSREDRPYARIYVRETGSLQYSQHATLAPDLALGLEYENRIKPTRGTGVFVRKDPERNVRRPWFTRDPAKICQTPDEYLRLAAKYRRIVTDRLHFAICGLILGRDTTILPNNYHKNESMYKTWLKDLGCRFSTVAKYVAPTEAESERSPEVHRSNRHRAA